MYRMPAEWELHQATLLCWPFNKSDWPGKFIPIHWVYAEIIKKLVPEEPVALLVQDAKQKAFVQGVLRKAEVPADSVTFITKATDRGWMRDSSPSFVLDGKGGVAGVHFLFNGWAKYDNWKRDKGVPKAVTSRFGMAQVPAVYNGRHVVLEGGAIDVNGSGSLLTTEECLLDPAVQVRNPGFTKADYESVFREYLGITNVLWLGKGIAGDDTHGHVDDLARFVNPETIVLCMERDPKDANYKPLQENFERMKDLRLENGKKPHWVPLPMPEPLVFDGMRLPASYANFYIGNNVVLVPTFNDARDKDALGILGECFPDRKIIGIHAVDLVWGLGTLHCLSHEIPAPAEGRHSGR